MTADILLDKTGEIQNGIDAITKPGFEYFKDELGDILDSYYNSYYRSMKCLRRNNMFGAHTMACSSMEALNILLYRINGMLHTYINRLPAMLHKLKVLPLPAKQLFEYISNIAEKADADSQIQVYLSVKALMGELGYGYICDAWEGELDMEIELAK